MTNKIDINKRYRTRNGREVRIYATDGFGIWAVHGAILTEDGWWAMCWTEDGKFTCGGVYDGSPSFASDLVEVKQRIKKTIWVNIDKQTDDFFDTKEDADEYASQHRIACVKIEIDCEEGEGL